MASSGNVSDEVIMEYIRRQDGRTRAMVTTAIRLRNRERRTSVRSHDFREPTGFQPVVVQLTVTPGGHGCAPGHDPQPDRTFRSGSKGRARLRHGSMGPLTGETTRSAAREWSASQARVAREPTASPPSATVPPGSDGPHSVRDRPLLPARSGTATTPLVVWFVGGGSRR